MMFLVVTFPNPARPSEIKEARLPFFTWIEDLKKKKKVICAYPKVGRGFIAIFDVASNIELHKYMTQWMDIMPVNYDIYLLLDPAEAQNYLKTGE